MFFANLRHYFLKYLLNILIISCFWILILVPFFTSFRLYQIFNSISYNSNNFSYISEIINPKNTKGDRILTCTQLQTVNLCFDSSLGTKNLFITENPANKALIGYKSNYQISDFDDKKNEYYLPNYFLKDFQTQNPDLVFESRHLFYFETKTKAINFLANINEDLKILNSSLNSYQVFNFVLEYKIWVFISLFLVFAIIFGANYFILNLHFKEQSKSYKVLQLLGFKIWILKVKQVSFLIFTSFVFSIFVSLIGANFILQMTQKQIFRNLEPYNFSPSFKASDIKIF